MRANHMCCEYDACELYKIKYYATSSTEIASSTMVWLKIEQLF